MGNVSTLGIDLAKNYIQIHGLDERGKVVLRKKVKRHNFSALMANMPACKVAMEACSTAHYWGRKLEEFGHKVKLLPAQHVKPFVRTNKDDAADAEGIAEASLRPNIRPVPIKSTEQLDFQALIRIRERYIKNRVQVYNEMRALLAERGVFVNRGTEAIRKTSQDILNGRKQEAGLTPHCRLTLADLHAELLDLDDRVKDIESRIKTATEENDKAKRLMELDGVGLIIAAAVLAAVPDPRAFKNGRQFAAWLGLVPKHTGSGGKTRNQGLSKRGNSYLRWLLIQGAQAMIRTATKRGDNFSKWAHSLSSKKKRPLAAVAVANKMARVIWAILESGHRYDPMRAAVPTIV